MNEDRIKRLENMMDTLDLDLLMMHKSWNQTLQKWLDALVKEYNLNIIERDYIYFNVKEALNIYNSSFQ